MVLSRAKRDAIWPVFEEYRDDGTDDNARYKSLSHGPAPILESWGVVPEAPHLGATCVMAESKAARDQLRAVLRSAGYAVESIEPDTRVSAEAKCLLFVTVHRAKGLEFQNVIVTSTTVRQGDREAVAPQLVYVALTRAKQRAALLTTP